MVNGSVLAEVQVRTREYVNQQCPTVFTSDSDCSRRVEKGQVDSGKAEVTRAGGETMRESAVVGWGRKRTEEGREERDGAFGSGRRVSFKSNKRN